jgi:5-methylcytosine-specific restriction protein A
MPERALRPCQHHGCPGLTRQKYCEKHIEEHTLLDKEKKAHDDHERWVSSRKYYNAQWNNLRKVYLATHPICEPCRKNGKVVPATLVHHVLPIKEGGARLDSENLMSCCSACHEAIHGKDRWKRRTY